MSNPTSTACHSDTSQNAPHSTDKELEYSRKHYRENPALYREYVRKYSCSHRSARYANLLVHLAIKQGKLTKQSCELCGNPKAEAHHDDYSKPLSVRWLCRHHHMKLHRKDAA